MYSEFCWFLDVCAFCLFWFSCSEQAIKDDVGTIRIQRPHKGPFYVSPKNIDDLIANLGKWARYLILYNLVQELIFFIKSNMYVYQNNYRGANERGYIQQVVPICFNGIYILWCFSACKACTRVYSREKATLGIAKKVNLNLSLQLVL